MKNQHPPCPHPPCTPLAFVYNFKLSSLMKSWSTLSLDLIILPAYRKSKSGTVWSVCRMLYFSSPVVIMGIYSTSWMGPLKVTIVSFFESPSIIKEYKLKASLQPLQFEYKNKSTPINCWHCRCSCISRIRRIQSIPRPHFLFGPHNISSQGYHTSGIASWWSSCSFLFVLSCVVPPHTCAAIIYPCEFAVQSWWSCLNRCISTCEFFETQLGWTNLAKNGFVDGLKLD